VLNSLTSASGQRTYEHAIREFVAWYCSEPRLAFDRTVVPRYRIWKQRSGSSSSEQGADDGDESGHLQAHQPDKVARQLFIERIDPAVHCVEAAVNGLETAIDGFEAPVHGLEAPVYAVLEHPNRLTHLDRRVRLLAHLALDEGHSFVHCGDAATPSD